MLSRYRSVWKKKKKTFLNHFAEKRHDLHTNCEVQFLLFFPWFPEGREVCVMCLTLFMKPTLPSIFV